MTAGLQIEALGGLRIVRDGDAVTRFVSGKAPALLCYLAVTGRPHFRAALAALLWGEQAQDDARRNLRVVLNNLRHLLAPHLIITRETIAFERGSAYRLDVEQFEVACGAAATGDMERLRAAVALYRGDFLDGFSVRDAPLFDEWALAQRERLRQRALHALHELASYHTARREYAAGIDASTRLLALDPWREDAHRQVMRLLALSGQRSAALEQYAACRRILREELGVEPTAETTALVAQIQAGQVGAPVVTPARPDGRAEGAEAWEEAPAVANFYGRRAELSTLARWITDDHCRLVAVLGMGGIGKTALAAQVARHQAPGFDRVIWRSLRNAPPLDVFLRDCLQRLAGPQPADLSAHASALLGLLPVYLRQQRCLLVLDNVESILQRQGRAGAYRPGYADYGQLFELVAQQRHRSCLLLTSRECPLEVARLARETGPARVVPLAGLSAQAGRALLRARGLRGPVDHQAALVARYSGNPLALALVADTILELFAGETDTFLRAETPIFDDIRDVLDQHVARLSALEQEVLSWLAIEREPVALATLQEDLARPEPQHAVLEAVRSLQRRALLDRRGAGVTLQQVILDYLTDRLVTQMCAGVETAQPELVNSHALLKAQAKESVRQSQARLLLQPVARRLVARLGQEQAVAMIRRLLDTLRATPGAPGYAAGNLLNLLLAWGDEVQGLDFSRLCVWQVDARGARLPGVSFAHADLAGSVFTDSFRSVNALAFCADGQQLAAATGDGALYLWQVGDGRLAGVSRGHESFAWALAAGPDGATLASGGADQTVRLWDAADGRERTVLRGHTQGVATVAFHPHGALLASGGADQTVRLWDAAGGRVLRVLRGHRGEVRAVAFSPDGALLASASEDHTVLLWEVASGQARCELQGHTGAVRGVAVSPDGSTVASSGWDRTVRLWDARSGAVRQVLYGPDWMEALAFSPDGAAIVSGGRDGSVRMWDRASGRPLRDFVGHTSWVRAVAFNAAGTLLASGGSDDTIRLWDTGSGEPVTSMHGHTRVVYDLTFSPDGAVLVAGSHDQLVTLWDVARRRARRSLRGHSGWVLAVAASPDGRIIASGGEDRTVRLWDARSGQALHTLQGHAATIEALAFSPDGGIVVSGGRDGTVRLWAVERGELLGTLEGHRGEVKAVACSADGRSVISGGQDQTVRVWELATRRLLRTLRGHRDVVETVALSPDGRLLASGSWDRTICLWDRASGAAIRALHGHDYGISSVAFSPDGRLLASGAGDRTVRVWEVGSGQTIATFHGHTSWVRPVAFSPDGATLASGGYDETIKLWDLARGACVATLWPVGPYAGLDITGATGLTAAQRTALKALGAVDG